ncbi:MAG: hypothetical protein Q8O72_02840 [Bacteroidales bacterium]|nr:hypothetical protein [Bacteroidales bacterium]
MGQICNFKTSEKSEITAYSPADLTAYRFIDSKYYISNQINGSKAFLEVLIKGKISIYYLRNEGGDHYFIGKTELPITELPYEEHIVSQDESTYKSYLVQSKTHIGILNYYMQDAPVFQNKIAKIKKPDNINLVELAKEYNAKMSDGKQADSYIKKQSFAKVNLQGVIGLNTFSNSDFVDSKVYFQGGILAHVWMPRANEKLYFRTGALFSVIQTDGQSHGILKIPLQLEYISPKNKVRPKFAFGVFVYSPFYQSVAMMGGVNIHLKNSIFISVDYDLEFSHADKFPLLPKQLFSQNFSVGFYYTF